MSVYPNENCLIRHKSPLKVMASNFLFLRDPEKCGQLKKEAVRYDTPVDNFTLSTHGAPLPQKASGGYWFWRIIWGMFVHAKNISLPNLDIYLASRNHGVSSKIWLI